MLINSHIAFVLWSPQRLSLWLTQMREWKMNMNFAQTKSKVNPTNQTILTCVLCLLSTLSLILFLLRGEYGLDINTSFLTERFVVYASLPLLVFIPFEKLSKIIIDEFVERNNN